MRKLVTSLTCYREVVKKKRFRICFGSWLNHKKKIVMGWDAFASKNKHIFLNESFHCVENMLESVTELL